MVRKLGTTKRIDTTTLAGLRESERMYEQGSRATFAEETPGWYLIQHTPFSDTYVWKIV